MSQFQLPVSVNFSPWSNFSHMSTVFLRLACVTWPTKPDHLYETAPTMFFLFADIHWFHPGGCEPLSAAAYLHSRPDSTVHQQEDWWTASTYFCHRWQLLLQHAEEQPWPVLYHQVGRRLEGTEASNSCYSAIYWVGQSLVPKCFPLLFGFKKLQGYETKNYMVRGPELCTCITLYWVNATNVTFCLAVWR